MKKIFNISLIVAVAIAFFPYASQARNCGLFMGKNIKTYGNLSCTKAKAVYKSFNSGHTPKGWTCGQSVGGCGKEKQGFYFKRYR
jgi:hypothetical protein